MPVGNSDNVRIVSAIIKGQMKEILLIAAYLPTGTEAERVIEFQETLERICSIMDEHGRRRMIIIGGDLNVGLTRNTHTNKKICG